MIQTDQITLQRYIDMAAFATHIWISREIRVKKNDVNWKVP